MGGGALWKIIVKIENTDISKTLGLEPTSLVGNLILQLTSSLSVDQDWSNHALWWPEKNTWLTLTRNSLEQYCLSNGITIEFLSRFQKCFVILPSLKFIQFPIDICKTVIESLLDFCDHVKIRRGEELSFLLLRNDTNSNVKSVKATSGTLGKSKKKTEISIPLEDQISEYIIKNPYSSQKYEEFNIKYPTCFESIFPSSNSIVNWCKFHENWTLSSKSLKEQGIKKGDVLCLRYKYSTFFDINPKSDPFRFSLIFCHAAFSIKLQEISCNETELYDLVAIIWQIILISNKYITVSASCDALNSVQDVDEALKLLENSLGQTTNSQNDKPFSSNNLAQSKISQILPSENSKKSMLYVIESGKLKVYKDKIEQEKKLVCSINLKGATITSVAKFQKLLFIIKISSIDETKGKQIVTEISFEHEDTFIKWLTRLRCVARGLEINHLNYNNEETSIKYILELKKNSEIQSIGENKNFSLTAQDIFPAWIFTKYARTSEYVCNQLLEYHVPYSGMTHIDAQKALIFKWQGLIFSNMIPFQVYFIDDEHQKPSSSKKKMEILGVCSKHLYRIDPNNENIVEKWSFVNLQSWNVNRLSNTQVFNFDKCKVTVSTVSSDIKQVHESVGGTIFINTRTDPSLSLNLQLFYKLAC